MSNYVQDKSKLISATTQFCNIANAFSLYTFLTFGVDFDRCQTHEKH